MPRSSRRAKRAPDEVRKTISFRTSDPRQKRNLEWYESFGERSSVPIHLIQIMISEYLDTIKWKSDGSRLGHNNPFSSSQNEDETLL